MLLSSVKIEKRIVSGHEVQQGRQEKSSWQKEKEEEDNDARNNLSFSVSLQSRAKWQNHVTT